ncbi:MAG: cupin domain-containing protein [Rubrimonas sp.]
MTGTSPARPGPWIDAGHGVRRRVLARDPALMVVAFAFGRDGVGQPHSHPHVQSTYVVSGRFAFTVAGQKREIGPGDSLIVPSGAVHGCKALSPGLLIDTFTPRRDDFL